MKPPTPRPLPADRPSRPAAASPWLEFSPPGGGPAQRTPIAGYPFSIGRNVSTDLPIHSTRVSREHAVIVRAGNAFRIRDLDSTNGTFVNGERIEEATLTDGDLLAIADVEFAFFTGTTKDARKTVTQVIGFRESSARGLRAGDVVRVVRRLQECLLAGGIEAASRPIRDLKTGRTLGWTPQNVAPAAVGHDAEALKLVLNSTGRLATRVREAAILRAAGELISADLGLKLFVPLSAADLEGPFVFGLLDRMDPVALSREQIVVEIPDSAVNDMPHFGEFYRRLRDWGVSICYGEFAAGKAQLDVHRRLRPDFVKLAAAVWRGAERDNARSAPAAQIVRAIRDMGGEPIATEVAAADDARRCRDLGFRYGLGPHLDQPLADKPALAGTAT